MNVPPKDPPMPERPVAAGCAPAHPQRAAPDARFVAYAGRGTASHPAHALYPPARKGERMASMGVLTGKGALVTHGSRGTACAIVRRLAADGAAVVFSYLSNEKAAQAV